jgi:hypothetical protein
MQPVHGVHATLRHAWRNEKLDAIKHVIAHV